MVNSIKERRYAWEDNQIVEEDLHGAAPGIGAELISVTYIVALSQSWELSRYCTTYDPATRRGVTYARAGLNILECNNHTCMLHLIYAS